MVRASSAALWTSQVTSLWISLWILGTFFLQSHAAMQHGKGLVTGSGLIKVVFAQRVAGASKLKSLLRADAVCVSHALSDAVTDAARIQIDDESRATAVLYLILPVGYPALGNFHHKFHALLSIGSNTAYRPHRMDFEIGRA